MKRLLAAAIAAGLAISAQAGPYIQIRIDSQHPEDGFILPAVFAGNTPKIHALTYQNGSAWTATNYGTFFWYGTNETDSTAIVKRQGTTGSGYVDFQLLNTDIPTNGEFLCGITMTNATETLTWTHGRMTVNKDPGAQAGSLALVNLPLNSSRGDLAWYDGTNWLGFGSGASNTYLRSLGTNMQPTWTTPAGAGDMLASVYDPNNKQTTVAFSNDTRFGLLTTQGVALVSTTAQQTAYATAQGGTNTAQQLQIDTAMSHGSNHSVIVSSGGFQGGVGAQATYGAAIGSGATSTGAEGEGGAVGYNANAYSDGGAIGSAASAGSGGAIGYHAAAISGGAIGYGAKTGAGFAGGDSATTTNAAGTGIDAIQLGAGNNANLRSMNVYGNVLLNTNGLIPLARLTLVQNAASLTNWPSEFDPFQKPFAASNVLAESDGLWQQIGCTGPAMTLYFPTGAVMKGTIIKVDLFTGTGTVTLATNYGPARAWLCTNPAVSIRASATNELYYQKQYNGNVWTIRQLPWVP